MRTSASAAVYCRISRARDGSTLGVQRQEGLCREIASGLGADVADVFIDNDVSATSGRKRPSWERMLTGIEQDRFDVVIALDSDRLLRKPGDLERLFTIAEKHNTRVAYSHGGFDPVTGDGMMEARIRAAVTRDWRASSTGT